MASASRTSSRSLTRCAVDAVALGDRGDVELRQVEAGRALHLLDFGEPLEDRVLLVAHDEEGDRHLVGDGAPEGADRVLDRALADHADDRAVGLGELHADRGGEAEAEAAAGARSSSCRAARGAAGCAAPGCWSATRARRCRPRGRPRPSAVCTVEGLSGSLGGISCGPWFGSGAGRGRLGHGSSSSAARVSLTSATSASPIGARAASSGSLVIATSFAPSGSSGPGDVGVVGEDRAADDEDQVVALERLRRPGRSPAAARRGSWGGSRGSRGGRRRGRASPRPAGAGARRARSPSSQAPEASMSGPATITGLVAASSRSARTRTAAGSATARPLTLRAIASRASASSTSAYQSSIGSETKTGPLRRQRRRGGRRGRGRAARPRPGPARRPT